MVLDWRLTLGASYKKKQPNFWQGTHYTIILLFVIELHPNIYFHLIHTTIAARTPFIHIDSQSLSGSRMLKISALSYKVNRYVIIYGNCSWSQCYPTFVLYREYEYILIWHIYSTNSNKLVYKRQHLNESNPLDIVQHNLYIYSSPQIYQHIRNDT